MRGHLAGRCALSIAIALAESLLVSGATFANAPWSAATATAFAAAFVGAVATWWLYFDKGEHSGVHRITSAAGPGRHARVAYPYMHLPIVAGSIVSAVADELVLARPDHASDAGIVAMLGGPALYHTGVGGFKRVSNDRPWPPLTHLADLAMLAALALPGFAHLLSALVIGFLACSVLVLDAVWEHVSLRAREQTVPARAQ